jgi:3-dehydroquinate synthase
LDAWNSLAPEVKAALIASEMSSNSTQPTKSSVSSLTSTTSSSNSDDSGEKTEEEGIIIENDAEAGTKTVMRPLERAPKNVFEITKTTSRESTQVTKTSSSTVTTKTTIMTTSKGWRNIFTLPISYDVNMVPNGTLLDPTNLQLLEATGVHTEGYNRRFAVIDDEIDRIFGKKIRDYFTAQGIELSTCVIEGGEPDKRPAVSICMNSTNVYCNFIMTNDETNKCSLSNRRSINCSMTCASTS